MEKREMYKAVCADCGEECEVPFKPDGTRPVYCRECFAKRRPQRSDFGRRSYGSNRSYRRY
jgi:CxxC-x17-CxxC domain-containing protein